MSTDDGIYRVITRNFFWLGGILTFLVLLLSFLFYIKNWPQTFPDFPAQVVIQRGSGPNKIVKALNEKGFSGSSLLTLICLRFILYTYSYNSAKQSLKAGIYEFKNSISIYELCLEIIKGEKVIFPRIRIAEGWTFNQMRDSIENNPFLLHVIKTKITAEEMFDKIFSSGQFSSDKLFWFGTQEKKFGSVEGFFSPDTYFFPPGTSDEEIYFRSYSTMRGKVQNLWRHSEKKNDFYKIPYELLVMASLLEKEASDNYERIKIAGVFMNRLQKNMRLQSDPTTIYGMGNNFSGFLSRQDTRQDTQFNTYTRKGLPPTPISLVSDSSLLAAIQPEKTDLLYFLARGDGYSVFSKTLEEHNQNRRLFQSTGTARGGSSKNDR